MTGHALMAWAAAALALAGLATDLTGAMARWRGARRVGGWLLVGAGVCAAGAFATGSGALRGLGVLIHEPGIAGRADLHSVLGSVGAMVLIGVGALRFAWRNAPERGGLGLAAAMLAGATALLLVFTGTTIRHG